LQPPVVPTPRPPTPPPPKYRHWDRVIKDFLSKLSLKQALTGFESDMLVMNPDFERANVPSAILDLLQGIIVSLHRKHFILPTDACRSFNKAQTCRIPWKSASSTMCTLKTRPRTRQ
jgi:hypothetical protein